MEARIDQVTGTVNTWIVGDDDEVLVVDPGDDAPAVRDQVGDREVLAVICTHGHAAHTAAALEVAAEDEAPVALHPADRVAWREIHTGGDPEIALADGGIFGGAVVALEVLRAPGGSPGAVCPQCEDLREVFSGDGLGATGPGPAEGAS